MKIIHVFDSNQYSALTVHKAISKLCSKLQIKDEVIDFQYHYKKDTSKDIVYFSEAHLINRSRVNLSHVRDGFPNAKLVVLAADTIHDIELGKDHVGTPEYCDLWLDTVDEAANVYQARGIKTDTWMWTISEYLLEEMRIRQSRNAQKKNVDFISLLACQTPYRWELSAFLEKHKLLITRKNVPYELDGLHEAYSKSRFVLGTTSPSWTVGRTMKGFRDWLGPPCGTVLVYDDHPDVIKKYVNCPIYKYDDLNSLYRLYHSLVNNPTYYQSVLSAQQEWIDQNTLEIQFEKLFRKHNIL